MMKETAFARASVAVLLVVVATFVVVTLSSPEGYSGYDVLSRIADLVFPR